MLGQIAAATATWQSRRRSRSTAGAPHDYARYLVTAIHARGIQQGQLQAVLLVRY